MVDKEHSVYSYVKRSVLNQTVVAPLRMKKKLLKDKYYLLRQVLAFIFGPVLIIGGFYLEFTNEMKALSQPFIYASLGLLCISLGTILLADGILCYLERKSEG